MLITPQLNCSNKEINTMGVLSAGSHGLCSQKYLYQALHTKVYDQVV